MTWTWWMRAFMWIYNSRPYQLLGCPLYSAHGRLTVRMFRIDSKNRNPGPALMFVRRLLRIYDWPLVLVGNARLAQIQKEAEESRDRIAALMEKYGAK